MNRTGIEYLDLTWNPIAMLCTREGPGCKNCWHIRMANRIQANPVLPGHVRDAYRGDAEPLLMEDRLMSPYDRRKPAIIGVQFMGDLFHKDVSDLTIAKIWRVMAWSKWHKFVVLTKRAERLYKFLSQVRRVPGVREWTHEPTGICFGEDWPTSNIMGMVSTEDQPTANQRVPWLLKAPLAWRGVKRAWPRANRRSCFG